VTQLQARIGQLQQLMNQDRATLQGFLQNGNIVYRTQQGPALVALNTPMALLETEVQALTTRAGTLAPAVTTQMAYDQLETDFRARLPRQRRQRSRLVAHAAAHPLNPTMNIGVAAAVAGNGNAIANRINAWAAAAPLNALLGVQPGFGAHPNDPRWQITVPAIPNWPGADPRAGTVTANGSIPTTAHGAHNLHAARTKLVTDLANEGFI
jgi:small-conductance mechanosensitive channel